MGNREMREEYIGLKFDFPTAAQAKRQPDSSHVSIRL